jgi:hypothetical protein
VTAALKDAIVFGLKTMRKWQLAPGAMEAWQVSAASTKAGSDELELEMVTVSVALVLVSVTVCDALVVFTT